MSQAARRPDERPPPKFDTGLGEGGQRPRREDERTEPRAVVQEERPRGAGGWREKPPAVVRGEEPPDGEEPPSKKRKQRCVSAPAREKRKERKPKHGNATYATMAGVEKLFATTLERNERLRRQEAALAAERRQLQAMARALQSAVEEVDNIFERKQTALQSAEQAERRAATALRELAAARQSELEAQRMAYRAEEAARRESEALKRLADAREAAREAMHIVGVGATQLRKCLGTLAGNTVYAALDEVATAGDASAARLRELARDASEAASEAEGRASAGAGPLMTLHPQKLTLWAHLARGRAEEMKRVREAAAERWETVGGALRKQADEAICNVGPAPDVWDPNYE